MDDRKIGNYGGRLDHTQGRFAIPVSPFKTAESLVSAIQAESGVEWKLKNDWIGGRGEVPVALNIYTREIMTLWRDSRNGWWVERKIRHGVWLPDIDYTLAIAKHIKQPIAPIKTCTYHKNHLESHGMCTACAVDYATERRYKDSLAEL